MNNLFKKMVLLGLTLSISSFSLALDSAIDFKKTLTSAGKTVGYLAAGYAGLTAYAVYQDYAARQRYMQRKEKPIQPTNTEK